MSDNVNVDLEDQDDDAVENDQPGIPGDRSQFGIPGGPEGGRPGEAGRGDLEQGEEFGGPGRGEEIDEDDEDLEPMAVPDDRP